MAACLPRMMPLFFSRKKNGCRSDNITSTPSSPKLSSNSNMSPQQAKDKVGWRSRGRATPNAKYPVRRSPSEYKSPICSEKSVKKELYDDLAEMMPLMETCVTRGSRSDLRPSRCRRLRFDDPRESKHNDPIRVEQLNHRRRTEADEEHFTCENASRYNDIMSDMLRLQNQINELNRKLWEKYCLLQYKKRTEPDPESLSQIRHLQNEVEALRGELTEKVRESQANMNEMEKIKSEMESAVRDDLLKLRNEKAKINQELNELRCQVAVLRYQLKLADLRHEQKLKEDTGLSEAFLSGQNTNANQADTTMVHDWKKNYQDILMDEEVKHTGADDHDRDMERNIELTKRQYFTALVIARQRPGEDSLAPAVELRTQLKSILGIPSFSSFA